MELVKSGKAFGKIDLGENHMKKNKFSVSQVVNFFIEAKSVVSLEDLSQNGFSEYRLIVTNYGW